jgi:cell division protein FtsI (penicillin-binding protein 3)
MHHEGKVKVERIKILAVMFMILFVTICARALIVQLYPPSKELLEKIAERQYQQHLEIAPYRGSILDRNGSALAISVRKPSIAINPRVFSPSPKQLKQIAGMLDLPPSKIKDLGARKAYFAWLKRRVDPSVASKLEEMGQRGLYTINEPARFYPLQQAGAHLIGSVGSDNSGLFGIERQFNQLLEGPKGAITPSKDAQGRSIFYQADAAMPDQPGHNIHLTIDHVIQEIAEDALKQGVLSAKAKSGFAIVSDPHTGKILALANYPTFDPNALGQIKLDNTRNYALMDLMEPGSVMKPFVIAAAIEKHKTRPDEVHNCEGGTYRVGGTVFRDDHPADLLTTTDTLVRSSNICTYKIAERLTKQGLYDTFTRFGFSANLPVDAAFPTYGQGHISSPGGWHPIRFANIAFGQGLTVTGLELAQALGALANGGNLMKPILVEKIGSPLGDIVSSTTPEVIRNIVSSETARSMRDMMAKVVTDKHGSGSRASTLSYSVGGKTGTAQKVDAVTKGYSADKRIASFIGFSPIRDPYIVVVVVIDEPGLKPAYGGLWAAPVFSQIAERTLRYLNVAPDILLSRSAKANNVQQF